MKKEKREHGYRLYTRARILTALAALAVSSQVAQAHGEPVTIYKETFGFCTGSLGLAAAEQAKWVGLHSGTVIAKVSNLKVYPGGSLNVGGSVNSDPVGLSQGYSFWHKPVFGLSVITSEFPINVSVLRDPATTIQYEQKLSGVDEQLNPNATHLIFKIGDTWYISEDSTAQKQFGRWETVSVNPSELKYGTAPVIERVGADIPTSFTSSLPTSGTVDAFGVFVVEVNGRVRVDNFSILASDEVAAGIPHQVESPDVAACPATSPDRDGNTPPPTPGPTPTPGGNDDGDDDDDDDTPEHEKPVKPTKYSMCTGRQKGYGRVVSISPRIRASLIKSIKGTTQLSRRDRALIAVLSTRRMPLGAVVNATMADFDARKRTLRVTLKPKGQARTIRLSKDTAARLQSYLKAVSAKTIPSAPLFSKGVAKTGKVTLQKAACLKDVTRVVSTRARAAKIVLSRIVLRSSR